MGKRESIYERMVEPEPKREGKRGQARKLPHTPESAEEEERVNPPGRSRGFNKPFMNVEDIPDFYRDTGLLKDPEDLEDPAVKELKERFESLPIDIQSEIEIHMKAFNPPLPRKKAIKEFWSFLEKQEKWLESQKESKKDRRDYVEEANEKPMGGIKKNKR